MKAESHPAENNQNSISEQHTHEDTILVWNMNCLVVPFVNVCFQLHKRVHDFGLAIQRSDKNRCLALRNIIDIVELRYNQAKTNSRADSGCMSKIDCLLVALVGIGFELDESFHRFDPAVQTSNANRWFALRITIDIIALT